MKLSDISLGIANLSEATSSKIGQEYFEALVEYLSNALKIDMVFIGELTANKSAIQTKAVYAHGSLSENITYELSGTPCDGVIGQSACFYQEGIQRSFPTDTLLKDLRIEGYVGAPLFSLTGAPFGLIVALHSKPILNEGFIQTYFDLVVGRVAAEYDRLNIMERLIDQEKQYRDLVDCSSDFIWEVNENVEYSFSSSSPDGLLGYTAAELVGKKPFDFMPKEEAEKVRLSFTSIWEQRETFSGLENINIHKDGTLVYIETSGVPIFDSQGIFKGYRGVDRNISGRKKKEIELKLAATVLETATEAVMVTDIDNHIIKVNKAFTTITGYTIDEVLGETPSVLKSGRHDAYFYIEMLKTLQRCGEWEGEIWNRRKNGEIYPEWLTVSAIQNDQGDIGGYVSLFSDITKRKEYEEKIEYQANYDALTGLANRHLLADRFSRAIDRADRKNSRVALLFIDLDRFKQVNDSLGHTFGDKLLQEVSSRLYSHVRKSDTTARLGGDEFAVIFPDVPDIHHVEDSIRNILNNLSKLYKIEGNEVYLSASIGVTVYPDDGITIDDLLRNADSAMYKAKENGRNSFQYYSGEMHKDAEKRRLLENSLRRAVNQNEFVLYYQPIVDSTTKNIVGSEALIRWKSPDMGIVSPAEFIPLAEDTGLILTIGEWVLNEACRQISSILPTCPEDFFVSINVSSYQFKKNNIPLLVGKALERFGLSPNRLVLEITESLMLNDDKCILEQLEELRRMGVGISIDDFGTGYSSLSYLHKYPISTLKIDRAFVNDLTSNKQSRALVTAIIAMSKSLGLKMVAEGIEEEQQAAILSQEGCTFFQGFLFSKPLPFDEFLCFIRESEQAI
ncbi:bifunctional diguanylate cyclase/phosphodiesterase [Amphritea sp.]|uniref:bifunctional diguanylate cyclase/phosphodiesterase n=1 Tax=Amphritea sp. TaxID=1872502 RepID=UPI0025C1C21D|nr:bifunctional diguanylate cyclase/phosphodiesterase [Amphritea sp.]